MHSCDLKPEPANGEVFCTVPLSKGVQCVDYLSKAPKQDNSDTQLVLTEQAPKQGKPVKLRELSCVLAGALTELKIRWRVREALCRDRDKSPRIVER